MVHDLRSAPHTARSAPPRSSILNFRGRSACRSALLVYVGIGLHQKLILGLIHQGHREPLPAPLLDNEPGITVIGFLDHLSHPINGRRIAGKFHQQGQGRVGRLGFEDHPLFGWVHLLQPLQQGQDDVVIDGGRPFDVEEFAVVFEECNCIPFFEFSGKLLPDHLVGDLFVIGLSSASHRTQCQT